MKYLSQSISATISNPSYLFLFILFSLLTIPPSVMKQIGIIQGGLAFALMTIAFVLSTFLVTGIYAVAWKNLKGESSKILAESKIYFTRILAISIVIGMITVIAFISLGVVHKMVFFDDVPTTLYSKSLDANLVRTIPQFLITTIFFYAFTAVIVANLPSYKALTKSWRFIFSHLAESRIVIILLFLCAIVKIIFTQWATNYDYNSSQYWQIMTASNIVTYAVTFLAFLTAAQIFEDLHKHDFGDSKG